MKLTDFSPGFIRRLVSISLSSLVILSVIYVNIQTASLYETTHGKNRALFGWIELIHFGYKYWLLAPALLALVLGLIDWQKGGGKRAILISILALFACALIFIRLWVLLITN